MVHPPLNVREGLAGGTWWTAAAANGFADDAIERIRLEARTAGLFPHLPSDLARKLFESEMV